MRAVRRSGREEESGGFDEQCRKYGVISAPDIVYRLKAKDLMVYILAFGRHLA